jgi:hypothetical protein
VIFMQCPNCGKEAINVNGRYVCLDCGIEITAGEAQAPVENTVANHVETVVEPAPTPTPVVEAEPKPAAPVYNEFIQELNTNSAPDPVSQEQAGEPIPDFPVGVSQPAPSPANPEPAPVTSPIEPAPADPFADLAATPPVDAAVAPEVTDQTATAVLEPAPAAPTPDLPPVADAPIAPASDVPEPVATESTPDPEPAAAPESYFQPSALDITPGGNAPAPSLELPTETPIEPTSLEPVAPVGAPAADQFTTPTSPAVDPFDAVAPASDSATQPAAFDAQTSTEPAKEIFETPTSSLDDLLNQYSGGTAPVNPAPAVAPTPDPIYPGPQTETPTVDPLSFTPPVAQPEVQPQSTPTIPGANNIPDPASVFGPGASDPQIPQKKTLNKWWIIGGAAGAVLLLAGLVFLGISIFKPQQSSDPNVIKEEETLKYSELVGKAMDPAQNMVTTFEQSLDFSGAEVKGSDQNAELLKLLFAQPVTAQGNWQSDAAGNISLESNFANVVNKRIYLDGEKGTYIFSSEAGTWNKSDGYQFGMIPPFYSPENKGGLFYVSKNDEITYLNDEELDGGTYKKIKLFPKKEIFQAYIANANPLLANIKYEEVNTDNIEVFAWIEESGKIHKVSVAGDLGLKSDLFDGTVKVSSGAGYDYKEVKITKP